MRCYHILKTKNDVAIIHDGTVENYDITPPFDPPYNYPEFEGLEYDINPQNRIYGMVRDVFIKLEMDAKNLATPNWNPFSEIIQPGNKVLIKPNFVKNYHNNKALGLRGVLSQITHAAVLRPIIDYVLLALNEKGRVIIADTPLDKADFVELISINKVKDLIGFYQNRSGIDIELYDLRSYKRKVSSEGKYLLEPEKLDGAPNGYLEIDLREESEFRELDSKPQNYYTLADFAVDRFNLQSRKPSNTNKFHSKGKHIYKIPRIVIDADVIISVPKLKTHKKAGISLNLKNIVGICEKLYMPHYRPGAPPEGDAYSVEPSFADTLKMNINHRWKIRSKLMKIIMKNSVMLKLKQTWLKEHVSRVKSISSNENENENKREWWGDWYGNDTLWRTILDLNKIALYADKRGKLCLERQREYFSIIDGIIGQEGEGPMSGMPKNCGVIIGGWEGASCDAVLADLMGYDTTRLKVIYNIQRIETHKLGETNVNNLTLISNVPCLKDLDLKFEIPKGYRPIAK